jgi:hypothetical protein
MAWMLKQRIPGWRPSSANTSRLRFLLVNSPHFNNGAVYVSNDVAFNGMALTIRSRRFGRYRA